MTLYKRRERFLDLSIRIGTAFSRIGLSPNQWTLLSLLPVLLAFYFLVQAEFLGAALLFIVAGFIDMIDGSVARVTGQVTKLGGYLDTVVDRYVEFIIVIGILFSGIPDFLIPAGAWILLYLFGSLMTTYAKAAAVEKGLVRSEIRGGLLERAERLLLIFIGLLLAIASPIYLTYVIVLLAVLTNISSLQRIIKAVGKVKE
jgi:phosphatidylglycerophosphate synthase